MKNFLILFLVSICAPLSINAQGFPTYLNVYPTDSCIVFIFETNESASGNFYWEFSDIGITGGGYLVVHSFPESGTYTVCANPIDQMSGPICVTVEVDCPDCDLYIEVIQQTNEYVILQASNFPESAQVHWEKNGQLMNIGFITTFILTPGENEICAYYETPECPEGVFWCETFLGETNPLEECPTELVLEEIECGWYEVTLNGAIADANIYWNLGDNNVYQGDGLPQIVQLTPGTYYLFALYWHPNYPQCSNVTYFLEVTIEDCDPNPTDCPTTINYTTINECGVYIFNLNNFGNFGNIVWNWGDGGSNAGSNNVGHAFFEPGTYEVCVEAWTSACPQGVEICIPLVVPDCDIECPEGIVASDLGCGLWMFALYPGDVVEGGVWVFSDGTSEQVVGSTVTHQFQSSGVYNIAVNSMLNSPCGNNYFTTIIEVDACEDECPTGIEFEELSCGNFVFWIDGAINDATVFWNFGNGNIVQGGPEQLQSYEPGFYTLYAIHSHPNYPDCSNQTYVIQFEVEDCDPNFCPSVITYTTLNECASFIFNINNFGNFGNIIWNWGDGATNSGANNVGHTYPEPGQYELCVQAWTGDCPEGVEICIPIIVEDCDVDCPTGIDAVDLGCGLWGFELGSAATTIGGSWFISNGSSTVTINGGHYITYQFEESGLYQIGLNAMLVPGCFNNYFITTIIVEVCEDECPETLNIVEMVCGYYYFMGWEAPGEEIQWSFEEGGQIHNFTTINNGMFSYLFNNPGNYEICAMYYSDNCTDGIELCETINVPDCNSDDCSLTLTYSYLGNGFFNFVADGNGGILPLLWDYGNGATLNATWVTQHQFEPGTYTVCVSYESNICTFPPTACVTIVVPEPEECQGYVLSFQSQLTNTGFSVVTFSLTDGNGIQFQGGTFFVTDVIGYFEGEVCLPDGCYTLDLTALEGLGISIANLDLLLNGLPFGGFVQIVQISNTEVQVQIDVNGDCDFSTGINDDIITDIQVYPIPATDILNIVIPSGEKVKATIFSTTGQVVYSAQLTQSVQLNVASWAFGLYLLKLENNYTTRTQRIQRF
jgi:hypothetical protein